MTATGTHPPFDRELGAALAAIAEQLPGSVTPDLIPLFRGAEHSRPGRGAGDLGADLPAGLITPAPGVYHTHGGGMVMGDNRTGMDIELDWAQELGLVIVSVEYRLAPEQPHPAPVEDCYAGLVWTAEHAGEPASIPPGC